MVNSNKEYLKKFQGNPTLIRLISSKKETFINENAVVQQKLTVINDGSVSSISMNRNNDIIESLNFNIDRNTAVDIISKIAKYFSNDVERDRYPASGTYDLTITNSEGISYFYDGSLDFNFTIDGNNISEYIREKLNMPQLFVFESSGKKKDILRLEINILKDNEKVLIDPLNNTLIYKYKNSIISIKDDNQINDTIKKYSDMISSDNVYVSNIGDVWDYEIKANFSYGDDLRFGGQLKNSSSLFVNNLLKDIKNIIKKSSFGSILYNQNDCEKNQYIVKVESKNLGYPEWYKSDEELYYGDMVIVKDNYGDFVIGKVIKVECCSSDSQRCKYYKTIINKL